MISLPLTVPSNYHQDFITRYNRLTEYNNKTLLFAADHLIEKDIQQQPQHLFTIAREAQLSMATQTGLISRYSLPSTGEKATSYIIKLTAKTPGQIIRGTDPFSTPLQTINELETFLNHNGSIISGIGLTLFIGSEYEEKMLSFAAKTIIQAHERGLPVILWTYIRGNKIKPADQITLLPFAANLATSLGADFAKLQIPEENLEQYEMLLLKTKSCAGNTRLLFAGGTKTEPKELFKKTNYIVHHLNWDGGAIGRALFMHSTDSACLIAQTMTKLMAGQITYNEAIAQTKQISQ